LDKKVLIAGFGFGLLANDKEPNISNQALASNIIEVSEYVDLHGSESFIASQWEITKALRILFDTSPDFSVELLEDGTYLDSKTVWAEMKKAVALDVEKNGVPITQVVIVAQPFLHLPTLKQMVHDDGFDIIDYPMGKVPFDNSPENTQPWTRSKFALFIYAIKSALGMKRGHNGMQNAA